MAAPQRPDLSASSSAPAGQPTWPVLARLPLIGGEQAEGANSPAQPPQPNFEPPVAAPQDVVVVPPSAANQPPPTVSEPRVDPPRVAHRIDNPFEGVEEATRQLAEDCAALDGFFAEELAARGETPEPISLNKSSLPRPKSLSTAGQEPTAPSTSRTMRAISARAFALHRASAPYASVIVTAALIACAGLLYWMMLGPGGSPALGTDRSDALQRDWQHVESEADATTADVAASAPPAQPVTPTVGAAAPAESQSPASVALPQFMPSDASSSAGVEVESGPALVTPLPMVDGTSAYPSTGHAPLDYTHASPAFATGSDAPARSPVAVARRPEDQAAPAASSAR